MTTTPLPQVAGFDAPIAGGFWAPTDTLKNHPWPRWRLRAFLLEFPEWSVVYHTQANHGLTVISRDPRDKPALPGRITMAANLTRAVAAHVADGLKKVETKDLQQRLEVCSVCELRKDDRCTVCGCYLAEKASWRSSECPLGKWNQNPEVSHVE